MKLGLVFTNDWELYGDGSGDYFEVQHNPMKNFIKTFDNFGAKISIMAEVGQQLTHKNYSAKYPELKIITNNWENLLLDAIKTGHDVQLHFHPQWLNAKYDGKWELTNDWSIGKLSEDKIEYIISTGKSYLEQLLKSVDINYECHCFRAGAYYIQPSAMVLKFLKEYNFNCDTSVTKGLISDNYFDYNDAYSNILPYSIKDDVRYKTYNNNDLAEFPIYSKISYQSNILKKFIPNLYSKFWNKTEISGLEIEWAKKRDKLKNIRYPKENRFYKTNQKKNLKFYLRQIFAKNSQQLDYDYIYPNEFINILKNIYNEQDIKYIKNKDIILPVISSGHIKDVPDSQNIEQILHLIDKDLKNEVVYLTLSEAVKYYYKNKSQFKHKD